MTEKVGISRQDVINDVASFVSRKYGGDYKKAFDAEDTDGDGRLSCDELCVIFAKSGIGTGLGARLERWAIAEQVITTMDADGDGYISFSEFEKMTKA